MMDPVIKAQWVADLRDPARVQGQCYLRRYVEGALQECCLGVLGDQAVKAGVARWEPLIGSNNNNSVYMLVLGDEKNEMVLTDAACAWAGLHGSLSVAVNVIRDGLPVQLTHLNDGEKLTFGQIADLIEADASI